MQNVETTTNEYISFDIDMSEGLDNSGLKEILSHLSTKSKELGISDTARSRIFDLIMRFMPSEDSYDSVEFAFNDDMFLYIVEDGFIEWLGGGSDEAIARGWEEANKMTEETHSRLREHFQNGGTYEDLKKEAQAK